MGFAGTVLPHRAGGGGAVELRAAEVGGGNPPDLRLIAEGVRLGELLVKVRIDRVDKLTNRDMADKCVEFGADPMLVMGDAYFDI
ncbi:hypothetical protein [Pedococcus ginsenosidimutans]|uniref:hypothetical protein n=1 Tax=Pedococcus ginsenosidimutans TaxID=490570 RepID=UPI0031F0461A